MKRVTVKPRAGFKVRRPPYEGSALLNPSGETVRLDEYWRRRVRFGDVVVVDQPEQATKTASKKPRVGEEE